ncbi:MAG: NAD-dependent epimerase/dehydratase family protein, partial [Gammaproteobacteria bacterium]|nr:NAD-dependent epimerase/dehydratase family protein [Gammaproteobacteria bacterium]
KVTVTGGAGFIGHHTVRELVSRGHEVTVLDDLSRGSFERPELVGARLLMGDVVTPTDCARAIEGADTVVHLAAISNVMGSQGAPEVCFDVNVVGSWNL